MLQFIDVWKSFSGESEPLQILKGVQFEIPSGEFVAIVGPSGSGKSTLLGIAAGLDQPSSGQVILDNVELSSAKESFLAELRRDRIGFVFQNFQLLPGFTAIENVGIPLYLDSKLSEKEIVSKAKDVLDSVSMGHRANHFPKQLSGGEEQRIAIARACINSPRILFADEPTANLDSKNSSMIMELLLKIHKERNTTLVLVTHDTAVAQMADRILEMKDGQIVSDSRQKKATDTTGKSKTPVPKKKSKGAKASRK